MEKNIEKSLFSPGKLFKKLSPGKVYPKKALEVLSRSPGRDIKRLVAQGIVVKVGPGLYEVPKQSRFGVLPSNEHDLLCGFLKTDDFLVFSPNLYNSLGLGLTQLKRDTFVYNKKRHLEKELSGRFYSFKRPTNGYPKVLTLEFLLVDLVNNIKIIGEDENDLKKRIIQRVQLNQFDNALLQSLAEMYGKVATKKFFRDLLGRNK